MNYTTESGVMTFFLVGHIDTANAPQVEKEIFEAISVKNPESVIIDAEKLDYISSSGLRILLKLRKMFPELKMTNVSSDVYEILDMTGFTEMLEVEKAYRHFDVTGCEIIGKGANGTVYRIDRDIIVKVYNNATNLDDIKRERELSRTAFVLGVPTAIPYDVVKVGNSFGSVFELLNAKSFDEMMIEDVNNLDFVVEHSIEIAKILHETTAPENLPRQSDTAKYWVTLVKDCLEESDWNKLKKLIDELPEKDTMIHGDLHIKNIMQQNDETLLIDMDTLSSGHPIYELAFMFNAYRGFGVVNKKEVEDFLGISTETAHRIWARSLETYLGTTDPEKLREVEDKASIIGYLRLTRRVITKGMYDTESGKALVKACVDKLHELLAKYDTLDF